MRNSSQKIFAMLMLSMALSGCHQTTAPAPDTAASLHPIRRDPATRPMLSEIAVLDGGDGGPSYLAFSPTGGVLCYADERSAKFWTTRPPAAVATFDKLDASGPVAFSADGALVALGCHRASESAMVCDVATGRRLFTFESLSGPLAFTFSPDGKTLAVAEFSLSLLTIFAPAGRVRLLDARSGKCLRTIATHEGPVHSLAFSPDGRRLALGYASRFSQYQLHSGGGLRIVDLSSSQNVSNRDPGIGWVECLSYSPDGVTLLAGGSNGRVRLFDANGNLVAKQLPDLPAAPSTSIEAVMFGAAGKLIFVSRVPDRVSVWDAANCQEIPGVVAASPSPDGHYLAGPLAISPDGRFLAVGWLTASAPVHVALKLFEVFAQRQVRSR